MSGRRFVEKVCLFGLMFTVLQNYATTLSFEGEVEGANSSVIYSACRGQNCTRINLQGQDNETVYEGTDDQISVEVNSRETNESTVFPFPPPPPPPPPPFPPSHHFNEVSGEGFTASVNGSGSTIIFERCITNSQGARNCSNSNLQGVDEQEVNASFPDNTLVDLDTNFTGLFDWVEPFLNITTFHIAPIRNLTAVRSQNGRGRLAEGNNRSVSNIRISYRDCVDNGQNGGECTGFDAIQQNGQLRLVNLPTAVDGSGLSRKRCLRTCTKYKNGTQNCIYSSSDCWAK